MNRTNNTTEKLTFKLHLPTIISKVIHCLENL